MEASHHIDTVSISKNGAAFEETAWNASVLQKLMHSTFVRMQRDHTIDESLVFPASKATKRSLSSELGRRPQNKLQWRLMNLHSSCLRQICIRQTKNSYIGDGLSIFLHHNVASFLHAYLYGKCPLLVTASIFKKCLSWFTKTCHVCGTEVSNHVCTSPFKSSGLWHFNHHHWCLKKEHVHTDVTSGCASTNDWHDFLAIGGGP